MNRKCGVNKEYTFKIGSYVRKWRSLKGIKQKQLASWLNLSDAALSHIENDITVPSIRQLEDIARSLDISIDMLIHGPEEIFLNYKKLVASGEWQVG